MTRIRLDGRVSLSGDDRLWVPTRCRSCPRFGYAPKDRLPADVHREARSDACETIIRLPAVMLKFIPRPDDNGEAVSAATRA